MDKPEEETQEEEPRRPTQQSQKNSQQFTFPKLPSTDPTQMQAVIEAIIEEKWRAFMEDLTNYKTWKEKTELQIKSVKQEIIRTHARFEVLEKSILGKIKDYDENVTEFSTDIKALSKVFEKILEPLKENIRELSRITEELKGK